MRLHPVTLAFRAPDEDLEALFNAHHFENGRRQLRIALGVVAVFFGGHSILDAVFVPDQMGLFLALRWGIGFPAILAMLFFSYTRSAVRFMQPALFAGTTIVGAVIVIMVLRAPIFRQTIYLGGLIQVCFATYTLLRMRFVWAVGCIVSLLVGFTVGAFLFTDIPRDTLGSYMGFMAGTNFLGMLACYLIEHYLRSNFYLSRQVESKQRRLDMANKLLEKRVEKRMVEMTVTNQQLEAEVRERKKTEAALQESKIRYGRMINNVTDYLCVHDRKGIILEVNLRMISGLGYSQPEMVGRNLRDFLDKTHGDSFQNYLDHLARGKRATGDVILVTNKSEQVLMEFSSVMVQNAANGDVAYCLARDVTERRRTEKALAESRARFKDIFEASAAGMMLVLQNSLKVVEVNPAAAQVIGQNASEIVGRPLSELIDVPLSAESASAMDPVECELNTESMKGIPILKTVRPMDFNGHPHWLISFISIQRIKEAESARREAETQLNRSQHLQAIGTLAGGIAHDFNNILYGVIGYTQLALDDAPDGSVLQENLTEILQGSQRAKELITQILAFSRQADTEKKAIQPAHLVKEALRLLRASFPATIEIQSYISPKADTILVNPTQLHQIVMNLCTNACHAMLPQGGLLKVSLENAVIERELPAVHGPIKPGLYVRLRVADNGTGMPASVVNRIFDPFYTTKPQGEGTGMGLAVVLGVVQSHDGFIQVWSEPGKGARFEVLLPVVTGRVEVAETSNAPLPKGTEHILFVDDERQIIQMGRQMLTKLGYQVTTCQNSLEALELFRSQPDIFDLVITDLTMPKLKGTKLVQHMIHIKPDLPVILCTGYGDEISEAQISEIGIRDLMLKPILREQLALSIRKALDDKSDTFTGAPMASRS